MTDMNSCLYKNETTMRPRLVAARHDISPDLQTTLTLVNCWGENIPFWKVILECNVTLAKGQERAQRSTGTFLRSFIWFLSLAEQNESIHEDQEEQRAGNRNNYTPHPLFYGEAVKCLCKWEEEVDGFSLQVIFSKNV